MYRRRTGASAVHRKYGGHVFMYRRRTGASAIYSRSTGASAPKGIPAVTEDPKMVANPGRNDPELVQTNKQTSTKNRRRKRQILPQIIQLFLS